MGIKPLLLSLFLAATASAEIKDARPEASADPVRILFTGGIGLPAPSLGIKIRGKERFECGLRYGWFHTVWTAEVHANVFAENPNPSKRGTWYGGPEFIYYNEVGDAGKFQLGFLSGVFGREKRITPRLRWAWEAGLGVMVFHAFQGGGVPILFPVLPLGRAEIRYAVL